MSDSQVAQIVEPASEEGLAAAEPTPASSATEPGDLVSAKVLRADNEGVWVELADGEHACVPASEWSGERPEAGELTQLFVEYKDERAGKLALSRDKADKLELWERLAAAVDSAATVLGEVVAEVKGGLSVDVGLRAFLPASQVERRQVSALTPYVGQRFAFRVLKFAPKRGGVVLSRRALLEEERAQERERTLKTLAEGDVLSGVVDRFTKSGAVVDIAGVDGLLDIDDASWGRSVHPSQLFAIGDELRVKVLKLDRDKGQAQVGLKQLTEDPWTHVVERYAKDSRHGGRVVSLAPYGAFIELEPGLEGLVHVSEMSWTRRIHRPQEVVKVGDEIEVVVLDYDLRERRIALGMRQLLPNPYDVFARTHPQGSRVRGPVRNITDFGAFVQLDEGVDGLVHVSDIAWTERPKPSQYFKVGNEIEAVVLGVDVASQRISLGIKQLTSDPWAGLSRRLKIGSKLVGKVTKVTDYGAFVEVEPGIEGLCHVSELAAEPPASARDHVHVGDELTVAVVDVDAQGRRISLSVRAVEETSGDYRRYMQSSEGFNLLAEKLSEKGIK